MTSSSCPTLISSSSKNDDDGADDDDDGKSSQHFTASMAVNTINSKNWGHSKSISPDALNFNVEEFRLKILRMMCYGWSV